MKNLLFFITVFIFFSKISYSQPGELDSSFGKNGIIKSDLGVVYDYVSVPKQVLEASDGTLYTVREQEGQTYITKRDRIGKIDINYGVNGISRAVNMREEHAFIQPDGKIVLAGLTGLNNRKDFLVARINTDGTLDNSFAGVGRKSTKFPTAAYATAAAIQPDGRIVLAGYTTVVNDEGETNYDFALARYNSNGTLDNSFSDDGILVTNQSATDDVPTVVVIQPDGKIVVAGSSTNNSPNDQTSFSTIIRYNEDGSIDTTFSVDAEKIGNLLASPNALKILEDGKLMVVGQSVSTSGADNQTTSTDIFVARYNANGSLDKTFNHKGYEITNFGYENENAFALAVYSSGKIGVGCNIYNGNNTDFALARYNPDGGLDSSFSNNGLQRVDFDYGEEDATLFTIHEQGKIVMAGSTNYYNLAIAHLNYDGNLDTSFNGNGKSSLSFFTNNQGSTNFTCTAVQSDGKIVVGGDTWNGSNTDFLVARYNVNGTPDSTFNGKGWKSTDIGVFAEGVSSLAIQSDGKIVAGGHTSDQTGIRFALARYNANGTLDSTFSGNGIQNNSLNWSGQINSITLQPDGKIVAAGNIWNGSNNDIAVARYNTNGNLDSTFNNDGILQTDLGSSEDNGKSVVVQADGKIVVAGSTYNYTNTDFVVVRYDANGILDASFRNNGIVTVDIGGNDDASGVALQSDGKIIVTGSTYKYDESDYSNTDMATTRLNTDGTTDNTFNDDGKVITDLGNNDNASSIAIERNGKIVIAGGSDSRFAFVRYTPEGILDTTFSQNGISTVSSKGSNAIENTATGIAIYNNSLYASGNGMYPANLGVVVKYQLDKGIQKPIVSITSPVNDTIYAAPAVIQIHATATDPDGLITKVAFYNGTTLLHAETTAPYGFTWNKVAAGNYTIIAQATDNNGSTTSAEVKVSVIPHKAPTVSITSPANNQRISGPATIRLRAAAIDPEGTITKVEFYNGTTLLRTEHLYPYTYTWIDVPAGNYSITARATNNNGLSAMSAAVHITVVPNKGPSAVITSIADGQNFTTPANIPLTASAKDPDGTINRVEFYNGPVLLFTQYANPYSTTWKNVPAGTYTITAKAIDNLGLSKTSAAVTVTVTEANAIVTGSRPSPAGKAPAVSLKAWPNPAGKTLIVYAQGLPQNTPAIISVFSVSGILMKTTQMSGPAQSVQLDVSALESGMYTVKVTYANKTISKQFIKL